MYCALETVAADIGRQKRFRGEVGYRVEDIPGADAVVSANRGR